MHTQTRGNNRVMMRNVIHVWSIFHQQTNGTNIRQHGALQRFLQNYFVQVWVIIAPKFGNFIPKFGQLAFPQNWGCLVPFGEFLSPTLRSVCPQVWGNCAPFRNFCHQHLGFFVPNFWENWGPKKPKSWGQKFPGTKNPKGGTISSNLGAKTCKSWGQKKTKVGDNNSDTWEIFFDPNFWEFLEATFGEVEDNISQKLGTKNPKSRGQKIPKGTAISQIWGQ